jgi:hypothetical protein
MKTVIHLTQQIKFPTAIVQYAKRLVGLSLEEKTHSTRIVYPCKHFTTWIWNEISTSNVDPNPDRKHCPTSAWFPLPLPATSPQTIWFLSRKSSSDVNINCWSVSRSRLLKICLNCTRQNKKFPHRVLSDPHNSIEVQKTKFTGDPCVSGTKSPTHMGTENLGPSTGQRYSSKNCELKFSSIPTSVANPNPDGSGPFLPDLDTDLEFSFRILRFITTFIWKKSVHFCQFLSKIVYFFVNKN